MQLADGIYWIACGVAILLAGLGIAALLFGGDEGNPVDHAAACAGSVAAGAAAWAIGWALRSAIIAVRRTWRDR